MAQTCDVLARSTAQNCDVLARRQQPLQVEDLNITKLLTDYGRFRVEELKKGKDIPPELIRRMKMLAIEEILAACAGAEMSEAELEEMLSEVKEHFTDLSEFNQQRKDNMSFIVNEEKENLEKFRKLHDDVEWERKTSGVLSLATAAAGLAVGVTVMCPVTLAGVALFSAISGAATSQHRANALQVQESLAKDMEAKNVPIQYLETLAKNLDDSIQRYLETLAKNLDDSIQRLESDAGKVSGRSARIKRRMDMMLEEIDGVQVRDGPWRGSNPIQSPAATPAVRLAHQRASELHVWKLGLTVSDCRELGSERKVVNLGFKTTP
eukprot:s22_g6.t1